MTTPAISVQLYSCRDHLGDLDGTLARLAGIGLHHVEAFMFTSAPDQFRDAFARHGLTAPTGHAPFLSDELRFGDTVFSLPPQEETFAAARTLGLGRVIDPMTDADRWATLEGVQQLAGRLNAAAVRAADFGLGVGYHNHNHEIAARLKGVTALEVFADLLDDGIGLEVDAYWAGVGGEDVPALLGRLGERVTALHVKNGRLDHAGLSLEQIVQQPQLPAGEGSLPMAEIIGAAPSADVVVIEFDTYDGDVFEGIRASRDFLVGLGLS